MVASSSRSASARCSKACLTRAIKSQNLFLYLLCCSVNPPSGLDKFVWVLILKLDACSQCFIFSGVSFGTHCLVAGAMAGVKLKGPVGLCLLVLARAGG